MTTRPHHPRRPRAAAALVTMLLAATSTLAASVTADATVVTRLSVTRRATTVPKGAHAYVTGVVSPSRSSRTVVLEQFRARRWRVVAVTHSRAGRYALGIPTRATGRFAYRVYLPAGSGGAATHSRMFVEWVVAPRVVRAPAPRPTPVPPVPTTADGCVRPDASNTGATGTLRTIVGDVTLGDGQTLANARVTGSVQIEGSGVRLTNSVVADSVFTLLSSNVVVDHVTAGRMAVSSSTGVTIDHANISGDDDGIHITSDRGSMNANIRVQHSWIHDPHGFATDAHVDGTQVRGVNGLRFYCNDYAPGAYQSQYNAAIYLEDANGGDNAVTIDHNWLDGYGYTLMMNATHLSVTNNVFGANGHWGLCDNGSSTGPWPFTQSGNTMSGGAPASLC